jgi:transposase-like protein
MAGKLGMRHYTLDVRQQVVNDRLNGMEYKDIMKKYDLRSTEQIFNWVTWYKIYGTPKKSKNLMKNNQSK